MPHVTPQEIQGRRVGSDRLFINDRVEHLYPALHHLWKDMHGGSIRRYFEYFTGQTFANLWPRLEVISDIGEFYLERHHDHLEKKLTALVYTDHQQIWPGTQLEGGYQIEAKDNRCMFFVPSVLTWHSYPRTNFHVVRRALQINYWTYPA